MPEINADEMAKAKVGFALRFVNHDLVVDATVPDQLTAHNQASLGWFFVAQETADERLGELNSHSSFPPTID
jgi:hypothetical protein